jgi:hypothetical protein
MSSFKGLEIKNPFIKESAILAINTIKKRNNSFSIFLPKEPEILSELGL